jgi:hypothetical protein
MAGLSVLLREISPTQKAMTVAPFDSQLSCLNFASPSNDLCTRRPCTFLFSRDLNIIQMDSCNFNVVRKLLLSSGLCEIEGSLQQVCVAAGWRSSFQMKLWIVGLFADLVVIITRG